MAHIINSLPIGPTSEAVIQEFETYIGHALPEDYRKFLLQHNGGSPSPDAFTLRLWDREEENLVFCFFPLRDLKQGDFVVREFNDLKKWPVYCAWDDLQSDLANLYEKELDNPVLPIGTDGSGNYFCLVLSGEEQGSIIFLENEVADTVLLTDSFTHFLDSLRPRERTDYAPEFG